MADEAFVTQQYLQVANTPEPYESRVTAIYAQAATQNPLEMRVTVYYAQVASSVAASAVANRRVVVVFTT